MTMFYFSEYEASRALPVEYIIKELEDFAATGEDLSGRRFSRSPPRVSSVPTTVYEETEAPSPNEKLQDKETRKQMESHANHQFVIQIRDELGRLRAARDKGLLERPIVFNSHLEDAAEANVKYRWIQQGIWDERWEGQPGKIWKHEWQDPLSRMKPSDSMKGGGVTTKKTNHKRTKSELLKGYRETVR